MVRIALGLEYHGACFRGWQSQPGGGTVQDALQAALGRIAGQAVQVTCAGRTDAGVHASAQVVHFDTELARPLTAWVRGVNSFLPPTVAVCWAQPVSDDFHARYSARARLYRYVLLNRPQRPGLSASSVGWYHRPLDAAAMQAGAELLLGEHDFSAFRAADCQARSPVRTMYHARVSRHGEHLLLDFEANAFLHHMVRNLVGSLVYVGQGKQAPAWMAALLACRDRTQAAPTFAAAGLYLIGVRYDPAWQLPPVGDTPTLPGEFA